MKALLGIISIGFFLTLGACQKANLRAGETSLQGDWRVTEIISISGERLASGIVNSTDSIEMGTLGNFRFSEEEVSYTYTRLDSLYEGTTAWELERERVNEGFVRVEKYRLLLEQGIFDCAFGDETSDAERDATKVRLVLETTEIGPFDRFELLLEKE